MHIKRHNLPRFPPKQDQVKQPRLCIRVERAKIPRNSDYSHDAMVNGLKTADEKDESFILVVSEVCVSSNLLRSACTA
jgi:hypothetical protein